MKMGDGMLVLDHLVVAGETLGAAAAHVDAALGVPLQPGGAHARFGTHNRLLGLSDGLYLEAIAVDPGAAPPPDARWFGLDGFTGTPRLTTWVCAVDDLDAALRVWPMAGRRVALSRGDLSWSMTVPVDGRLPFDGLFPALIQWHVDMPPGRSLPASGCGLRRLLVTHPRAPELQGLLAPHLDAPQVTFESGAAPALTAELDTPRGTVWLA